MILGAGVAYRPVSPLMLGLDLRWVNFTGTRGFEEQGLQATPTGPMLRGTGWDDIWVVAAGAQYSISERLALRLGYNYSENPIPSEQQFFNVLAPVIFTHHVTAGLGYWLTPCINLNLEYAHAFEQEQTGPILSSGAPGSPPLNQSIPGTTVTNSSAGHIVGFQVGVSF